MPVSSRSFAVCYIILCLVPVTTDSWEEDFFFLQGNTDMDLQVLYAP